MIAQDPPAIGTLAAEMLVHRLLPDSMKEPDDLGSGQPQQRAGEKLANPSDGQAPGYEH